MTPLITRTYLCHLDNQKIKKTRGSQEPVSLTLVYVHIKQITHGFMTKLCFGDGDVFVDLSLLNILVVTIISIYNELGPVITVENIS